MPNHIIDAVSLIPQTMSMACWYASAQMLIAWRRGRSLSCEVAHPDPSDVPALEKQFMANDGLPYERTIELSRDLGLAAIPFPHDADARGAGGWLFRHGPIWFAGLWPSGHAVVITGIDDLVISISNP